MSKTTAAKTAAKSAQPIASAQALEPIARQLGAPDPVLLAAVRGGTVESEVRPVEAVPDTPEAPAQALAVLAAEAGPANPVQREALRSGTNETDMVEAGRRINSSRIIKDTTRLYRIAFDFIQTATPAQLDQLHGCSCALIVIAIHEALGLEVMFEQHKGRTSTGAKKRKLNEGTAERSFDDGMKLRDQIYSSLQLGAAQDAALVHELVVSVGTAEDGGALANGMEALVGLGRKWLGGDDAKLVKRLELGGVDEIYLARVAKQAASVRKTAGDASNRSHGAKVTQGQLDRADGLNLFLLGQVIRAFDCARAIDPTIPRLVPIATRHRSRKGQKADPPAEAPK